MPDADDGKAAHETKDKDNQGMWEFIKRVWDSSIEKIVFVVSVLMLVIYALGGIPGTRMTAVHSGPMLGVAIPLLVMSLIIWLFKAQKPQGDSSRVDAIIPLLMVVMGIVCSGAILLSHFGWGLPRSERSDVDDVVIGLALASWCGFIPAYLSAKHLRTLPPDIQKRVKDLTEQQEKLVTAIQEKSTEILETVPEKINVEISRLKQAENDLLAHLKESETDLVNHIEDATRALLKGFDQVFARAFQMIKDAQDELVFVNFTMNFGSPHRYNQDIVQKYKEHNGGADLAEDAGAFLSNLQGKIHTVQSCQILTVSSKGADENFLSPLSRREGYGALKDKATFDTELAALNQARDEVTKTIENCRGFPRKRMFEVETLPMQLLITGLPRRSGRPRSGCLVFIVGSDMLQSGLAPGSEPAFYTELDDMVGVFRGLAHSLIQASASKAEDTRPRR